MVRVLTATVQKSLGHFLSFTALADSCVTSSLLPPAAWMQVTVLLLRTLGECILLELMRQCVCSCIAAAKELDWSLALLARLRISYSLKRHRYSTERPLHWDMLVGHNPPSRCHQKGLNRTIVVKELFGDSGIMHTKQVGNKSDEESFFTHLNHCNRKKGLLLLSSWLLSFTTTGEMLLSQSIHECSVPTYQWTENISMIVSSTNTPFKYSKASKNQAFKVRLGRYIGLLTLLANPIADIWASTYMFSNMCW